MHHLAKGDTFQDVAIMSLVVLLGMCEEENNKRTIGTCRSDLGHKVWPDLTINMP
jgi:hypothetical protein